MTTDLASAQPWGRVRLFKALPETREARVPSPTGIAPADSVETATAERTKKPTDPGRRRAKRRRRATSTRARWAGRSWRGVITVYAAVLLAFLVSVKSTLFDASDLPRVLVVYGVVVGVYLGTRVLLACAYRASKAEPPSENMWPSVAVVVPTFNEQDRITDTIESLLSVDYPADRLRVIVLDDGSSDETWARVVGASRRHPRLDAVKFSRNRGKRAGMAAGTRAAEGSDVVLFVDSDSILEPRAVREIVRPFLPARGRDIACVTGHADVLNPEVNLLTRLQQVRYYAAFRIVKAAESIFGVVSCASGCFSAYRRGALMDVLSEWETQSFLGREATFGDDRALTNYLLADGWRVVYQSTAISSTAVPETWAGFLRQQLRWKKSWTRESLRVMRFAWHWHPIAAASMYASILLQLVGPLVGFYTIAWLPATGERDPWLYLVGLHAMAVLYGLFYAYARRNPNWWGGILFALAYSVILSWQTYWAIVRSRDTGWGTRASDYDTAAPLMISATLGSPGHCGIPLTPDAAVASSVARADAEGDTIPDHHRPAPEVPQPSKFDWVVGTIALPLSSLPILAWLVLR